MWGFKDIDRFLYWALEEEKKSCMATGQTGDLNGQIRSKLGTASALYSNNINTNQK